MSERKQRPATEAEAEAFSLAEWGRLSLVCQTFGNLDLDYLLDCASFAHAAGPIADPTLYRDGRRNVVDQEKVLKAALAFRQVVDEVKTKASS